MKNHLLKTWVCMSNSANFGENISKIATLQLVNLHHGS